MTNSTQSIYVVNTPLLKKLKLKLFGKLIKKEVVDYGSFKIEFTEWSYARRPLESYFMIRKIK